MAYEEKIIKELNETLKKFWDNWKIEKKIGRGSFGDVYSAVHEEFNVKNYAAIKVISVPSSPYEIDVLRAEGQDENAVKTFLNDIVNDCVKEIQLMEALKGASNIVSVEDFKVVEKTDGIGWDIFMRMELLQPFTVYSEKMKWTEGEIIKLGCDICTALEWCAKQKEPVIHRDIKPENIFRNRFGDYKLGDFGVARQLKATTHSRSYKGSPNYMAPEVSHFKQYDSRVDTYSLGIVLYQLLNDHKLPFWDVNKLSPTGPEQSNALARRMRGESILPPRDGSKKLKDVILRACAYEPEDRFSSATEMREALLNCMNQSATPAPLSKPAPAGNASGGSVTILRETYDIATTTKLDLSEKNITDDELKYLVPQIEKLTNLKSLTLFGNRIHDLTPLEKLIDLNYLSLASIPIFDISVLSNLTNLERLDLSYNDWLSDIKPLATLTNLEVLDLKKTKIADLTPISNLANLWVLWLHDTSISDIEPISGLANLWVLDLSNTPISDISPIFRLANLRTLDLSNTPIRDIIPIYPLANLEYLDLSDTLISDISPILGLANLEYLDLSDTLISDISPILGLANLEWLDLSGTKISEIKPLSELKNLTSLNLHNTQIRDLDQINLFQNLRNLNLSGIKIDDNHLLRISSCKNLTTLNLSSCQISSVFRLYSLSKLESLDLIDNPASEADIQWLKDHLPNCKIRF